MIPRPSSVEAAGPLAWPSAGAVDKLHTLDDDWAVEARFDWNLEKNQQLVEQRGISFERVVSAIEQGGLVDVLDHPNQQRYRGQMIYVVDIDGLNAEEREILEHFERGELTAASEAQREMETAQHAARNTFNKTRRVNLRVTERDFNLAHARAREEGIPYQTLLSSVIHKYLSGRLTENR